MEVYREDRTLDRPPGAVARAVFGAADDRHRTTRRFGLYRTETVLDEAAGELRTTVAVPGVGLAVAAAVCLAALGLARPGMRLVALWTCALAVVGPLGHLLAGLDARPDAGRVTQRRVSPATAPAYAAAVGSLWLTLAPALGHDATFLCAALLVVGAACYAVGAGWRTPSVSTLWLPAAGLLPVLSAVAALAVALSLAGPASPGVAVAAGASVTLVSLGVLAAYSYLVCRSVRSARFAPLGSTGRRVTLLVGYLGVVAVLVGVALRLAGGVADRFGLPVAAALAAPLVLPAGGWLHHAGRTTVARVAAVRRATRRTVDGVPVYVLDVDAPVVHAVSVPRGVIAARPVVAALSDEELAAVVAHERHHLRDRARLAGLLFGAAAVVVGRNPVAAFRDHPARERSADRYAAERAGVGPLVRALRRMEGLDRGAVGPPRPVAAPHALLYGSVADAAVYPSVDERIAAVSRTG